jgi:hypothetical protein
MGHIPAAPARLSRNVALSPGLISAPGDGDALESEGQGNANANADTDGWGSRRGWSRLVCALLATDRLSSAGMLVLVLVLLSTHIHTVHPVQVRMLAAHSNDDAVRAFG